jgi:hypothetical protein
MHYSFRKFASVQGFPKLLFFNKTSRIYIIIFYREGRYYKLFIVNANELNMIYSILTCMEISLIIINESLLY